MQTPATQTIFDDLHALLGDRLTADTQTRNAHGAGFSYHACQPPDWVVYPNSTEEVAEIVRLCAQHQVPIVPFGAGTSIEGHILALHGGVCMDLSRMNTILDVNTDDLYAVIQPGVTRNQLDGRLDGSGFFFPIGPGVNATLGGMAATRASGTNAVRYGTMKDNVLALTVVLPDGQMIKTGSRARKSSTGYDLTRLFVGSEGTLGIITELTIRLHPYPEAIQTAICAFPSVDAAVSTAIRVIQKGVPMAKIELLDALMLHAINRYSDTNYPEKPTLFLEFNGSALAVQEQIQTVERIAQVFDVEGFTWAQDEASRQKLWRVRTDAAPSALALRPGSTPWSTDVCVPISKLAQCIAETQADIAQTDLTAPILGHVGDGNFHVAILIHPDDPDALEKANWLNSRMVHRALAMGGTCSGEHGIGVGKLAYMEQEHGNALAVMRAIKQALDPHNLMNPGKLLPA